MMKLNELYVLFINASDVLFDINGFEVTVAILIYSILVLVLLIALISYRFNHRTQQKANRYMDDEALVFNKKGLEKYFKKKRRKFSNPTLVVVEIRNLDYLYTNYKQRNKLIIKIADILLAGLKKVEVVGRVEFNKFIIAYNKYTRDQIREKCIQINQKFEDLVIEDYGKFDFNLFFGIYEEVPLKDKEVLDVTCAIIRYSNMTDGNRYYYCQEVSDSLERIKRMNTEKDYDFEQRRFVPYIQPKVDFKTGRVVGGEILVRWVDENNNFKYSPAEFIPLFESNGFVKKIDDLMFQHACLLAKTLSQKGHKDVVISVNVSKVNFLAADFERKIRTAITDYQVDPKHVEIEVTETVVTENFQHVSNSIMSLRQMGFNVAMDDFGQEYSSLGLLSTNPFDTIKLDRIFFRNKLATEKDRHIVRNLLEMLTKLNYKKVCEGVSDKQTLDVLATINQDVIIQGFCISTPIPVTQFEAFLDTVFEFNYPPVESLSATLSGTIKANGDNVEASVEKTAGNTSINISGLGGNNNYSKEFEEMRNQMAAMEIRFQERMAAQQRQSQEDEIRRLREEMAKLQENPRTNYNEIDALRREVELLRNQNNNTTTTAVPNNYGRDDEVYRLRRELEDLRYQQDRDRDRNRFDREYYEREMQGRYESYPFVRKESEYESLQRQIQEIRDKQNSQPQLDVNLLIEKLSKNNTMSDIEKAKSETQDLRAKLEKERKEKEELEALLNELQNKQVEEPEDFDEAALQEEADNALNLDLDSLKDDFEDDFEDDEDDSDDEEPVAEKITKPNLTLEELEAIIKMYQDKYQDNWNQKAKEELKDGYYEVVNGLKYYKGRQKLTFKDKMKNLSPELKQIYNIVKNEFMKYKGVTNKLTNSYDCFYIGRKQVAKISFTSKKMKVFLAANPANYPDRQFPHKDLSNKKAHARTPYYTLIKSSLSVRRINKVYADVMQENGLVADTSYKPIDYAIKFKFMKNEE